MDICKGFAFAYSITADLASLDFGNAAYGYAVPTAQTVTITNTGNQTITLAQPTAANYTIGTLSTMTLAPSSAATFTVQPNAGLGAGKYDEDLTISGDNGVSAKAQL